MIQRDLTWLVLLSALLFGSCVGALGLSGAALPATAVAADRDCSDFDTQREAQRFFLQHGGPQNDPHQLDADNDGKACETLPCPCHGDGGGGGGGGGGHNPPDLTDKAHVREIVDGDTIKVRLHGHKKPIRLIGIDTPEVYGGQECGGEQASNSMNRMLSPGFQVTLTRDPSQANQDRYGRLLRYVNRGDSDIGRSQIRLGWARVYVFNNNPFRRVDGYRDAQDKAKNRNRGVWDRCNGHFHQPE